MVIVETPGYKHLQYKLHIADDNLTQPGKASMSNLRNKSLLHFEHRHDED